MAWGHIIFGERKLMLREYLAELFCLVNGGNCLMGFSFNKFKMAVVNLLIKLLNSLSTLKNFRVVWTRVFSWCFLRVVGVSLRGPATGRSILAYIVSIHLSFLFLLLFASTSITAKVDITGAVSGSSVVAIMVDAQQNQQIG
ncbi:hypothetical protein ACJX0J_023442 [Zea mays]